MRVVVVGATGNVGTSVLEALAREPRVESVLGLARRLPARPFAKATFAAADVTVDDLTQLFAGADAVVHLAWLIQPARDPVALRRTNVDGSSRVFAAVAAAGVPALVYASSIGVYAPGPRSERVDETWPREGVPTATYSQQKAEVERRLDAFEARHLDVRVVRLRYAFALKRLSASEQRRYFLGPLVPTVLLRRGLVPFVPHVAGLRAQVVHTDDVGEAYRLALVSGARGAFNLAAEPPLTTADLARLLGARPLRVPASLVRAAAWASWHARLQPTPPDWIDLALGIPLLDTGRARSELGWEPRRGGLETAAEWLAGLRAGAGAATPPLRPGRLLAELTTRIGGRSR